MKVVINGFEVNITAKDPTKVHTQKDATLFILNTLAQYSFQAGKNFKEMNYDGLSEQAFDNGKAFYDVCEKEGYYNIIHVWG